MAQRGLPADDAVDGGVLRHRRSLPVLLGDSGSPSPGRRSAAGGAGTETHLWCPRSTRRPPPPLPPSRNTFHAQLEAAKSAFDKLRERTGLAGDGAALVDAALSLGHTGVPVLAINPLTTKTERDEQTGLANLIKGLSGMFRNPVVHDPRLRRTVTDDELLELLTTLSIIHRRLDAATLHPRQP